MYTTDGFPSPDGRLLFYEKDRRAARNKTTQKERASCLLARLKSDLVFEMA